MAYFHVYPQNIAFSDFGTLKLVILSLTHPGSTYIGYTVALLKAHVSLQLGKISSSENEVSVYTGFYISIQLSLCLVSFNIS